MAHDTSFQQWCDTSLRRRLDRVQRRRTPRLPPPQVLVTAPGTRFTYGAVDEPFHCASIGKVFVAVLTARLAEQGLLTLDSRIASLAPHLDLSRLPAAPGVDLGRELTVAHLLAHRSGLPDPVLPPRGHRTACSIDTIAAAPDRLWTPAQVVAQTAGLPPTGAPGTRFRYSDAGYALLLCVLEVVGGAPFPALLREHVFAPAGMSETAIPHATASDEELAALRIAPVRVGRHEVSRHRSLSAAACDGGAVTTLADLARFQSALHEGGLVAPPLLARLSQRQSRLRAGIHYGTGLATLRPTELAPLGWHGSPEPVGGLGLWATHCFYYREQRAQVIMNLHATREMPRSIRLHLTIIRRLARIPA